MARRRSDCSPLCRIAGAEVALLLTFLASQGEDAEIEPIISEIMVEILQS